MLPCLFRRSCGSGGGPVCLVPRSPWSAVFDETRQFDPPVTDPAAARLACKDCDPQLAQASWDLIVYSGKPSFVEADKALPSGSIHVRAPLEKDGFGGFSVDGEAFDIQLDPSADLRVSFYRSLALADGGLLVGGCRSTLIALTVRIPIVAVARFGGNPQKVRERLWNANNDASKDDVAAMAASLGRKARPGGWWAA